MTGRSPMPPPTQRHPDRRQDILEEAHRSEAQNGLIPGSLTWYKRRTTRLETLLSASAIYLNTSDADQDLLVEAIYKELSARRGE